MTSSRSKEGAEFGSQGCGMLSTVTLSLLYKLGISTLTSSPFCSEMLFLGESSKRKGEQRFLYS